MASNFRTCLQCSTRNRLDKEFCVKCGESLEGVSAGDPAAAKKAKPGFLVSIEGEEAQSPLIPLVFVILTLGVVFAAWRTIQSGDAASAACDASIRPRHASARGRCERLFMGCDLSVNANLPQLAQASRNQLRDL